MSKCGLLLVTPRNRRSLMVMGRNKAMGYRLKEGNSYQIENGGSNVSETVRRGLGWLLR